MIDSDYLVCGFTLHTPGSTKIGCAKCGREMYLSPISRDMLIGNPSMIPICLICARPGLSAKDSMIVLTRVQENDLLGQGFTKEQIDVVLARVGAVREEDVPDPGPKAA